MSEKVFFKQQNGIEVFVVDSDSKATKPVVIVKGANNQNHFILATFIAKPNRDKQKIIFEISTDELKRLAKQKFNRPLDELINMVCSAILKRKIKMDVEIWLDAETTLIFTHEYTQRLKEDYDESTKVLDQYDKSYDDNDYDYDEMFLNNDYEYDIDDVYYYGEKHTNLVKRNYSDMSIYFDKNNN